MRVSDDMLAAYADGELKADEREAVQAALRDDPALAMRLARHEGLRTRLGAAYDPVLDEPLPVSLLAAASSPPAGRVGLSWRPLAAMAACLILGLAVGRYGLERPLVDSDMAPRGALAKALESQLAASPPGAVRIGVTFRRTDGGYCRTFEAKGVSGLACRSDGGWRVEALAAASGRTEALYRTASSVPPAIVAAIEARIAGEPLDADQEAAAAKSGWRATP